MAEDVPNAKKSRGFRVGRYFLSQFLLLGLQKMPKSQNVSNMPNEASERTLSRVLKYLLLK